MHGDLPAEIAIFVRIPTGTFFMTLLTLYYYK